MSKKPSYLGMLNAIALGEGRAHRYLRAWMEKCSDPEVCQVLATVAIREGEHAMAFEKRLCELGFSLLERPDSTFEKTLDIVTSPRSDLEKFRALGYGKRDPDAEDPFSGIFKDRTIDIQTGELLGRYIAEERDSGRRLQACYEALEECASGAASDSGAELSEIRDGLTALSKTVKKLAKEVAALS